MYELIAAAIAAAAAITTSVITATSASELSGDALTGLRIKTQGTFQTKKVEGLQKNTDMAILAYTVVITGAFIFLSQLI